MTTTLLRANPTTLQKGVTIRGRKLSGVRFGFLDGDSIILTQSPRIGLPSPVRLSG